MNKIEIRKSKVGSYYVNFVGYEDNIIKLPIFTEEKVREWASLAGYEIVSIKDVDIKKYKIGVIKPSFCDQPYLRDRDEWYFAESAEEAKNKWFEEHKFWLRSDEKHLLGVIEREE